jgi:hypothetical protein
VRLISEIADEMLVEPGPDFVAKRRVGLRQGK